MRTTPFRTAFLLLPFSIASAAAAPIQDLTFTEVIKDVFIIDPGTKKETPAKSGDKLVPPNVLKTGADSRAELVAEDKTVTRVGSNTIFSVEANSRDVNLTQGSVLFHSPAGRGGGRIKSAGATASVLGTTLAVSANSDGGFKTSLLEGKGEVKGQKGGKVGLVAGQVTFAKPGGGLSPALNFDLKAQISNSKLVGGFSAPLASIAKIEAAVAVQQAKIAGGELASTDMLIGDRPDTAFKVDPSLVEGLAKTRELLQEKAAKETQTFYEVDPRYLERVIQNFKVTLSEPPTQLTTEQERHFFIIDRTGRTSLALDIPNAIGGVPSNLPGNQQDSTVTIYAAIAQNITFEPTKEVVNKVPAAFFTGPIDPTQPGSDSSTSLEKTSYGLVAIENIELLGNIDFLNLDNVTTTPDGVEVGLSLLMSAGKTIAVKPGSIISANTSLFEIFTAGTSFSPDLSLRPNALKSGESFAALSLDTVAILQKSDSANSALRITAPEISLTNTLILSASRESSEIAIQSAGPISISTTTTPADPTALNKLLTGLRAQNNQSSGVSLGFNSPHDLSLQAFRVGIESKSKTVSISGVNIAANEISLRGGDELTLSSVQIDSYDISSAVPQTFTASAVNNVTITSNASVDVGTDSLLFSAVSTSEISSSNKDVSIANTTLGSSSSPSDAAPVTSLTVNALKGAILLNASAVNADTVLFNGNSVTLKGVYVGPTDSDQGTITVNSASNLEVSDSKWDRTNSKTPTQNRGFKAYKITLDAKDNMTLTDLTVDHVNYTKANEFAAKAGNQLEMKGVDLKYAQTVALEAQTLVLADTQFKGGATVRLTSGAGVLSTPTTRDQITKGWVNVLPKVMYGTYDLNNLSTQMGAFGTETGVTKGIPAAKFTDATNAVKTATGVDLSKVTISAKTAK
jgi:hypothetical protein